MKIFLKFTKNEDCSVIFAKKKNKDRMNFVIYSKNFFVFFFSILFYQFPFYLRCYFGSSTTSYLDCHQIFCCFVSLIQDYFVKITEIYQYFHFFSFLFIYLFVFVSLYSITFCLKSNFYVLINFSFFPLNYIKYFFRFWCFFIILIFLFFYFSFLFRKSNNFYRK